MYQTLCSAILIIFFLFLYECVCVCVCACVLLGTEPRSILSYSINFLRQGLTRVGSLLLSAHFLNEDTEALKTEKK